MLNFLFIVTSFICLMLASVAILAFIYRRELIIEQRIVDYLKGKNSSVQNDSKKGDSNQEKVSFGIRVFTPVRNKLKNYIVEKMSGHSSKTLEKKLREAGNPKQWTAADLRLRQVVAGLGLFLLMFFLFTPGAEDKAKIILLSIIVGVIGYVFPIVKLNSLKKKRMKVIQKSMPDFFDMVSLAIEAGMGLDAALAKVCKQKKGPLSEEFLIMLEDLKLGKSRREAFTELRNRVPLDHFQSTINAIIHADHLGIGMAQVLRTLTLRIREQRRELAREQAMKVPVKMLFPMVFFIFPTIFIIILGPLALYFLMNGIN
ncbi:type II secretion system F family protein [Anaerobacillus sp. MEB173]|uniref:type II secretion system F family protein n=1 Tax=Anaerobacillus sp. MEB173 TaxID=3383345 RepID=UPI003F9354B7